jgi:hypothetical protein
MKMDSSAFQDTTVEWGGRAVKPVHASRMTRTLYCLALLGFAQGALGQDAPWISLATSTGLGVGLGTWVLFLISGAMAFRVYVVVSYPAALDARPPRMSGWLLRWLGWIVMLAGTVGLAAMLLVKALSLLLFNSPAPDSAGLLVVGFWVTLLASSGWLGCLLFEVSRRTGYRVTPPEVAMSRRQRIRDTAGL